MDAPPHGGTFGDLKEIPDEDNCLFRGNKVVLAVIHLFFFISSSFLLSGCVGGARTRATGRTGSGTGWAWSPAGAGSTGANGRRASRAATASGSPSPPRPSTTGPGPTDFRTATAPRPTRTEVWHHGTQGTRAIHLSRPARYKYKSASTIPGQNTAASGSGRHSPPWPALLLASLVIFYERSGCWTSVSTTDKSRKDLALRG